MTVRNLHESRFYVFCNTHLADNICSEFLILLFRVADQEVLLDSWLICSMRWPGGRRGWLTTTWWMVCSNKSCFNSSFMILAYIYYQTVGLVGVFDNPLDYLSIAATSLIICTPASRRWMDVFACLRICATDSAGQDTLLNFFLWVVSTAQYARKVHAQLIPIHQYFSNRKKELTDNKGTAVQRYLIVSLSPRGLHGLRPSSAPEDDFSASGSVKVLPARAVQRATSLLTKQLRPSSTAWPVVV